MRPARPSLQGRSHHIPGAKNNRNNPKRLFRRHGNYYSVFNMLSAPEDAAPNAASMRTVDFEAAKLNAAPTRYILALNSRIASYIRTFHPQAGQDPPEVPAPGSVAAIISPSARTICSRWWRATWYWARCRALPRRVGCRCGVYKKISPRIRNICRHILADSYNPEQCQNFHAETPIVFLCSLRPRTNAILHACWIAQEYLSAFITCRKPTTKTRCSRSSGPA